MVGIINDILNPVQVDEKIAPLSNSYQPDKINFGSDDTVEGRVAGIISSDSKLNTLARTGAAQTANSRGLLNTSMAIGEGEKAVIETATPIAAQDAQSSLAVKTANQNAQNQMLSQQMSGDQNLAQIDKQGQIVIPPLLTDLLSRGLSCYQQLPWRHSSDCSVRSFVIV